jgi:ribonucleoside-triphosphate reductase
MSYTEIMNFLKLNVTRDAGRFAYHLKFLLGADLIEPDSETKKYRLTDLGRRIIEITDEIERKTYKRRKMLVRTSRFTMEEFDRNRISQSLVREANVPTDLAQKVARETEKRLQRFKTKYLTAPLIREIVNAILLEKHYEDYRHRLTRLGLPVYDVTQLIETRLPTVEAIHKEAGNAVMEEYALLSILPRNVSDAHLNGSINLHNLGTWVLKPNEITHNLQYFFQDQKPKSFEAALTITNRTIQDFAKETSGQQNLEKFISHLAPYGKDTPPSKIKELLRLFIQAMNQVSPIPITMSLEFSPEENDPYSSETFRLTLLLLEALMEENRAHPLQNPKVIIKVRQEQGKTTEIEPLFHEVHKLAATSLLVYFANLCPKNQANATYTSSGLRLSDDWYGDRELDTQRTGNLDTIAINLPRISFEAKGDESRFFELLESQLNIAKQALEIKFKTMKKRIEQDLLPRLTQKTNGDEYFRLKNATRTVVISGLKEAVNALLAGKEESEGNAETSSLAVSILEYINQYTSKHTRKPQTRLTSAIVNLGSTAERLAELDVERYGWGIAKTRGTKEHPHYSDISTVSLDRMEQLHIEERIHQLTPGGHLAIVENEQAELSVEDLQVRTRRLAASELGLFCYKLSLTFCSHCKKTSSGTHLKCPECGSTNIVSFKN